MRNKQDLLNFAPSEVNAAIDRSAIDRAAMVCPPSLIGHKQIKPCLNQENLKDLKALVSYDGGSEISIFGQWRSDFLSVLEESKQQALNAGEKRVKSADFGAYSAYVYHNGVGGFGSGVRFSYIVDCYSDLGLCFKLYFHKSPCDSIPAVRVHFCYPFIRNRKIDECSQEIQDILSDLGLVISREVLSRLDFNVTFNKDISYFKRSFEESRFVSRARKTCVRCDRSGNWETFEIGSLGGTVLKIYDKLAELTAKVDDLKAYDLINVFKDSSSLTRVEFSLYRQSLYGFEVTSSSDFVAKSAEIVGYLVTNFFWIDSKTRSKDMCLNKSTRLVDPLWRWLSDCFMSFFESGGVAVFTASRSEHSNVYYVRLTKARDFKLKHLMQLRKFKKRTFSNLKRGLSLLVRAASDASPVRMNDDLFMRFIFGQFFKRRDKLIKKYDSFFCEGYKI